MKIDILGVLVDRIDIIEAREYFSQWLVGLNKGLLHQIVTVNPEFVMEARKNTEFRNVLNNASLALADGVGLVLASAFLHGWKNRLFRMTGVECVVMLARMCACTGSSIYLLGASTGVAERVAEVLQRKYSDLRIVGAEEGIPKLRVAGDWLHVTESNDAVDDDEMICKRIVDAKTDVLLVAFGAPKQDIWIARNVEKLNDVRIAVGVGGAFDYLSGLAPYAPAWMRTVGLEWLYRLVRQPQRISRIITAVVRFPFAVFLEKCHFDANPKNPDDSRDTSLRSR